MTNTETIAIEQDLWEDAKASYDNVSGKIRELLNDDLDRNTDQKRPLDIIKNSSLTKRQKQVARQMIQDAVTEKTGAQMNKYLKGKSFNRNDYRRKFKSAIKGDEKIPYDSGEGRGSVIATDFVCECDASMPPKLLQQNEGHCLNCNRRIVDFKD